MDCLDDVIGYQKDSDISAVPVNTYEEVLVGRGNNSEGRGELKEGNENDADGVGGATVIFGERK